MTFILWIFLHMGPSATWVPIRDIGSKEKCTEMADYLLSKGVAANCREMEDK